MEKLKKQGSQYRFFPNGAPLATRLEKNDFVRLILRVYFGPTWSTFCPVYM